MRLFRFMLLTPLKYFYGPIYVRDVKGRYFCLCVHICIIYVRTCPVLWLSEWVREYLVYDRRTVWIRGGVSVTYSL